MQHYEKIKQYIETICEQIRWKRAHESVAKEIKDHIYDRAMALTEAGTDEEQAFDRAIKEMGDPILIGSQLDRTHRPKPDWSIVGLTAVAILMGLFVRWLIPGNANSPAESVSSGLLIATIGFVCMFAAYAVDFSVIGKHPFIIYCVFVALLYGSLSMIPSTVNSSHIYINGRVVVVQYMLLIFPTVFAGILYFMRNKGYLGIILSGLSYLLPVISGILGHSISSLFFCSAVCLILLTYAIIKGWFNIKRSHGICLVYGSGSVLAYAFLRLFIFNSDYRMKRFIVLINPAADPYGSGYVNMLIRNIIRGAEFLKHGSILSASDLMLPNADTDYLLTYLIGRFGFAAFILIMSVFIAYILRLIFLSKRQKSVLGKLVSTAIILTFSIQIAAYVFNNLGFQILSTLPLPFIAYGGINTIINMLLIGIVMSVFKSGKYINDDQALISNPGRKLLQITDGKIIIDLNIKN